MDSFVELKTATDDFDIEFEVKPLVDIDSITDEEQKRILAGIASVEERLSVVHEKVNKLNADIDRLTNHADGMDYAIAVTSGIIAGILDATAVGEWNFAEAKKESYQNINNKVVNFAKRQPDYEIYCSIALEGKRTSRRKPKDPNRLETAIEYLEWKFHLPGDGAYKMGKFGIDGNTHRLDDFCHHPTLVGLVCCIIVQFTGRIKYVNKYGEDLEMPITVNEYGNFVGTNEVTKLFSGIINWFIICAKTFANREGHLMSDIATPASLPGSFLSMMSELASIPCFRNEDFLVKLRDAFKNGIGVEKNQVDLGVFNKLFEGAQSKLDVVTEGAIANELRRQAMPVVFNEILIRAVYFLRRLISELKEKRDICLLEWKKILPFNNRTIVRMMTIATGTFTAIDMADAAVRSATKFVDVNTFLSNMFLRVNFVGVGRFTIAFSIDTGMGITRAIKNSKSIKLRNEEIYLLDAKLYYKQAGMWIAAEDAGHAIEEAYSMMEATTKQYVEAVQNIKESLAHIQDTAAKVEEKNPGLIRELTDILEWE